MVAIVIFAIIDVGCLDAYSGGKEAAGPRCPVFSNNLRGVMEEQLPRGFRRISLDFAAVNKIYFHITNVIHKILCLPPL